jgi:glycosyltransferase involved in cell wall biosynthesis
MAFVAQSNPMRAFLRQRFQGLSIFVASVLRKWRRKRGVSGANLVGFFTAESGLGQSVRSLSEALKETGLPYSTVVADWHPSPTDASSRESRFDPSLHTSIVVLQPESLSALVWKYPSIFRSPKLVAYWTWELPVPHSSFARWANLFDEIWVPSTFVKVAMENNAPGRVYIIPPPVRLLPSAKGSDPFTFLSLVDYYSVFERKNPLGVVEAFKNAFTPSDHVRLIIKCQNVHADPKNHERLVDAAQSHPHISIVTDHVSRAEADHLLASANVFVSLHRSEGFGIAIQEAMVMGVPIVSTQWSGSADLVREEVAFPVQSHLVTLDAAQGIYEAGSQWAEPNLQDASRLMRYVYENQVEAQKKGALASEWIKKEFSTRRVAGLMQSRLNAD